MKVFHRQQFSFPPRQPFAPLQILAFGAMAIAAGVVADALIRAVAAALHMPAKGGCPAHLDGAHEPVLLERQSMLGAVDGAVAAEDIGHFKGDPAQPISPWVLCFCLWRGA